MEQRASSGASIDYGLIDRMELAMPIFYPSADPSPPPAGAEDHLLEVAPGVSVGARHYVSGSSSGTILYFHGNGEVVGDHDGIAPLYHRIGLDLFVVDYRGYGRSGGRPSFDSLVRDAHPVAERFHSIVAAKGAKGPRFVMGRSLGANPALELAARRPEGFAGLVLESAAASLRRFIARFAEPAPAGVSEPLIAAHEAKIASIALPTLLLHGERDTLIPLDHARDIHDLLQAAERSLVVIARAGHNDILFTGQSTYFQAIRAFVQAHGGASR
jgi:alpha-beta hydrolase superfamily lysophospholipase